jgi:glycosyltransferase involved in cell wall biosynthesis
MQKKKVFIFCPYPVDTAPSQRFRYEQYINLLEKQDFEFHFFPFIDTKTWNVLYQKGHYFLKTYLMLMSFFKRWRMLFKIKEADVVFIHREMTHFGPPIFEWFISKVLKVKYIYDFDDAIWLPNYSKSNAKFQWIKCYWKVPFCIKWAHKVSVGNQFLADYAQPYNSSVVIIPTTLDTENYHNQTIDYAHQRLSIGWTGTLTTMNYLYELEPVIAQLEKEFSFDFIVISNQKPKMELQSLRYIQWNKDTEIADLMKFSIGVMPLKEDKWSKGKCGFKALQYMSLGIPCVISPVGVNTAIVDHQTNGFLATSNDEFYSYLKQLLENAGLRNEIGLKGQQTVVNRYSTSANLAKYVELLQ